MHPQFTNPTKKTLKYFRQIASQTHSQDRWVALHRQDLMAQFGVFLTYIGYLSGNPKRLEQFRSDLELAENTYASCLGMAATLIQYGQSKHWEVAQSLLEKAIVMMDEIIPKKQQAHYYYLKGFLDYRRQNPQMALKNFELAISIYPHPENSAAQNLLQLYVTNRQKSQYLELRHRLFKSRNVPKLIHQLDQQVRKL